ncbi:Hypothetical protein SMAX5B_003207 [Scophthalmus maximus]|uniref:Uncharacterized protein n=1 Tax=Scophthalmus maximus TaxID=52904 RepID=A0A2U9BDM0_SCOMX|nr:Hypothetical protein SMAX5B_003207 [Scophthalmus maximus]
MYLLWRFLPGVVSGSTSLDGPPGQKRQVNQMIKPKHKPHCVLITFNLLRIVYEVQRRCPKCSRRRPDHRRGTRRSVHRLKTRRSSRRRPDHRRGTRRSVHRLKTRRSSRRRPDHRRGTRRSVYRLKTRRSSRRRPDHRRGTRRSVHRLKTRRSSRRRPDHHGERVDRSIDWRRGGADVSQTTDGDEDQTSAGPPTENVLIGPSTGDEEGSAGPPTSDVSIGQPTGDM